MALVLLKRAATFTEVLNYYLVSTRSLSLLASRNLQNVDKNPPRTSSIFRDNITTYETSLHLSPLFQDTQVQAQNNDFKIEFVDAESWEVSQGLAQSWRGTTLAGGTKCSNTCLDDEGISYESLKREEPDIDEIEDLRIRGNLFYKLDRGSKEFEEYNFDFHRRKSGKGKADRAESKKKQQPSADSSSKLEKSSKNLDERKETRKKDNPRTNSVSREVRDRRIDKKDETNIPCVVSKMLRTPTFNQLTAPYHEPFCLDIYISKASVRACIIHRATSKVVAVAHSISKDMKFDLGSTRNATACAAVGEVLAQRALADDIHNAVYTPRKGEKLEGKLQIVLQAIISNGVNVKVKIKQRKSRKTRTPPFTFG